MVLDINGNNVNFDEVVDVFDTHGPYCKEVEVHGFNTETGEYTHSTRQRYQHFISDSELSVLCRVRTWKQR